jgi:proteic killer suppression protein
MIRSFRNKETERIWQGRQSQKFPGDVQNRALRKLRQLDASLTLEDLRNPPGNQLEALRACGPVEHSNQRPVACLLSMVQG